MSIEVAPSRYQLILLQTDGTVTDLVRLMSGEDIALTKLSQNVICDRGPRPLELEQAGELLHRRVLLSGRTQHYVYAESYFVLGRMTEYLRKQLLESDVPIGLLWQRERLETFREIVSQRCEADPSLQVHFPGATSGLFLARSYRVHHGGRPLGLITEKFPRELFASDG